MRTRRVVIIGAGVGGLTAALDLAARGVQVVCCERAAAPGGKVRQVQIGQVRLDAGPTVFTMRSVFDALFADAGLTFADHASMQRTDVIARHAWSERESLDLHAELSRSTDAVGRFAGAAEARRFTQFMHAAERLHRMLERTYLHASRPTPLTLTARIARQSILHLPHLRPFVSLWRRLGGYFRDPRLQQLFGRYATYCGASPFEAPATLMLIAHVERDGVWLVEGGMQQIALAVATAAARCGAQFHYRAEVAQILLEHGRAAGVQLASGERIAADAVIVNADADAVRLGLFGAAAAHALPAPRHAGRSLSAITWNMHATASGFPLHRHTVFFSSDYRAEFDALRSARTPRRPTVYVCAQDRADGAARPGAERLLCLINAPAYGDLDAAPEIHPCETRMLAALRRCGLNLHYAPDQCVTTTPQDFHRMFPGTGGALYGRASHGWRASFERPAARTRVPGLYLAGGSTHPGPGVPMAALSGRLAAASLLQDWTSPGASRSMVTVGGTSTR